MQATVKSVLQILLTLREARDVCLNYRLGDIHLFPGCQWRMRASTVYMSASPGTVLTSDTVVFTASRASSRCTFRGASCWRCCPRQECLPEVPCLLNGRSHWWGIWSERLRGVQDKRLQDRRLVLSWTRSIMEDDRWRRRCIVKFQFVELGVRGLARSWRQRHAVK